MLKIGVMGVGHLGKIHLNCLKATGNFQIVGFFDINKEKSQRVTSEYNIPHYDNYLDLIEDVDAIDIISPTATHYELAKAAITRSRHVFIEKPLASNKQEANELIKLTEEAEVIVQIGHVERFNPAYLSVKDKLNNAMFMESHRLSNFNPRGTDISVIYDLMIHDIDIVTDVIDSSVKKIHASGIPVISDSPDIANARIEFANGAVANLTASRISLKKSRMISFYQNDSFINVDFLNKKSEVVSLNQAAIPKDTDNIRTITLDETNNRKINVYHPQIKDLNAIQTELQCFHDSVINNTTPAVTINDGYEALLIAQTIMDKLNF